MGRLTLREQLLLVTTLLDTQELTDAMERLERGYGLDLLP